MLPLGAAGATAVLAGGVSATIAFGAWRALLRTGNKSIGFVVAGFALLATKLLLKGFALAAGAGETPERELLFSVVDLAAFGLIAWPIVSSGGQP